MSQLAVNTQEAYTKRPPTISRLSLKLKQGIRLSNNVLRRLLRSTTSLLLPSIYTKLTDHDKWGKNFFTVRLIVPLPHSYSVVLQA